MAKQTDKAGGNEPNQATAKKPTKAEEAKDALRERLAGVQNVAFRVREIVPIIGDLKKSSIKEVAEKAKQLEKLPGGTEVVVKRDWLAKALS